MDTNPKGQGIESVVRVRRGRVDSVDLYEIKDGELDLLERGSPADLQLNFAVFLLSTAFSSTCTLATATFANPTVHLVFVVVAVVGVLMGAYLLLTWWRNRTSLRALCKEIRARIPPDLAVNPEPPTDPGGSLDTQQPAG